MIYLNGGFSAIESPFQDGGGATIDRSTVGMIIAELEDQRAELEAARRKLLETNVQKGSEAARVQELNRLSKELAETRSKLEFMERRARLNRDEAGPLSNAELQKELEEEIRRKNLMQAQNEQIKSELRRSDESVKNLQKQQEAMLKELAVRADSLEKTQSQLSAATGEAARLSERLTARESELRRSTADLGNTRKALATAEGNIKTYRKQLGDAQSDLAYLRGRSTAMEKELAGTRDRLLTSEKNTKAREIELAAAKTRLENMQGVLKNAVSDLSQVRNELATESTQRQNAQKALAKLQGDYNAVASKLQNAEEKLRSDVLTRYTQAALKLNLSLREQRLIRDREETVDLYLPAVRINNADYLISALSVLAGSRQNSSALNDVIKLQYSVNTPNAAANSGTRLSGPIFVEKSDCRVAMIQVTGPAVKPLKILTKNELKQRGIQDLYLFKVQSFGKDSTILDSRCSMSFENNDDYLYIRNGARVSSELKAEVGDLVLTKQGELAAIVVALEDYDFGRQQEARCFVFNTLPQTTALPQIPLTKAANQQVYRDFCDKLNFYLEQAKPLDAKKRRR